MIKLKEILLEDPDKIIHNGNDIELDNAVAMLLVYHDTEDRTLHYVISNYNTKEVTSDSKIVEQELKDLIGYCNSFKETDKELEESDLDEELQYLIKSFRFWQNRYITHGQTLSALQRYLRTKDERHDAYSGRLFKSGNKYILSAWGYRQHIIEYKVYIEKMLSKMGIDPKVVLYQSANEHYIDEFDEYDKFFSKKEPVLPELSGVDLELKKIAEKLHVEKALLNKAILDVIRSNPEELRDIYAQFEHMFKMPFVQIKHILGNLPLYIFKASQRRRSSSKKV